MQAYSYKTTLFFSFLFAITTASAVTNLPQSGATDLAMPGYSNASGFTLNYTAPATWGYYQPGGFVEYSVNAPAAGNYTVQLKYATPFSFAGMNIFVNQIYIATKALPQTASWGSFQQSATVSFWLSAGQNTIRVGGWDNSDGFNIQGIHLVNTTPVATAPAAAAQVASTTTLPSTGSVYLPMDSYSNSAGFTLGTAAPRTWGYYQKDGFIEYTVYAPQKADYKIEVTYATPLASAGINSYVNDVYVSTINLASTASWSTFAKSSQILVSLAAGKNRIRISGFANSDAFNIQAIQLFFSPASVVVAATTPATTPVASAAPVSSSAYPFAGQSLYVDRNSQAAININACSAYYPSQPNLMQKIASQPTAVWFGDWFSNVGAEVASQVTSAQNAGTMPTFVTYNIPHRDCGSFSSGGATVASYPGWIDQFAQAIGNAKVAVIIEPDALSQMNQAGCLTDADKATRYQLLSGAVASFRKYAPNAAIYLDAGNPSWIPAATMASQLTSAGIANANGFSLNVSNFDTTDANTTYGNQISALVNGKHFVIDTSRNGSGPTADRQWCNPLGRSLGRSPAGFSSGALDAYLWIKAPGESDGTCNGGPSAGTLWVQYACDMAARTP